MFAAARSPFGCDPLLEELLSSVEEVDGFREPPSSRNPPSKSGLAKRRSDRPGLAAFFPEVPVDSRPTLQSGPLSKDNILPDRSEPAARPTTLFPDSSTRYPSDSIHYGVPSSASTPCSSTPDPDSRRLSSLFPDSSTRSPSGVTPELPSPDLTPVDPALAARRPSWGVMGSFLGRLARSGSCSTSTGSSNGSGQEEPCALVSVERISTAPCGNPEYSAPIVGYEVMEERARFTVFKVRVEHQASGKHWFVFRRYTDFARLNRKLRCLYRGLRFSLPPKRWFGDNFDPLFLEDRLLGLQAFVNNIIAHMDISKSSAVREFFCFDDPPSPDDSLEESRALCENLEEAVLRLQGVVRQKDREADLLRAEVTMLRAQQQALLKSLKLQSRLSSVAYAQMLDDQQQQQQNPANISSQSKQFLAHMHKVNQFNLALSKTIDRSLKTPTYSDQGSRMSLSRVDEENPSDALSRAAAMYQKTVSLDDICSRSTGDGSTGSQERLPPLGGASDLPFPRETQSHTVIVSDPTFSDDSTLTFSNGMVSKDLTQTGSSDSTLGVSNGTPCKEVNVDVCKSSETLTGFPCDISETTNAQVAAAQLRDLKLDSVSFKKLLENNPDLGENGLKKTSLRQSVVPLACISLLST